jgi:hypothetical protein
VPPGLIQFRGQQRHHLIRRECWRNFGRTRRWDATLDLSACHYTSLNQTARDLLQTALVVANGTLERLPRLAFADDRGSLRNCAVIKCRKLSSQWLPKPKARCRRVIPAVSVLTSEKANRRNVANAPQRCDWELSLNFASYGFLFNWNELATERGLDKAERLGRPRRSYHAPEYLPHSLCRRAQSFVVHVTRLCSAVRT